MNELCTEFEQNISKYSDFKIKAESLVREILIQNDLSYHKIESRVKDSKTLHEKIQRKSDKYSKLNEITDLVGIRIITFYEDEVDKIADIIEKEFIKDTDNSIDKRVLENDKFGYRSLHYVVSLSQERKKLTEYSRFFDLKIEIQIRSILQHAWAEIEHDIGYKGEFEIPKEFKRDFYRVAALLETSDLEFLRIRDGLKKYENEIKEKISTSPKEIELNKASLESFLINSKTVAEIDIAICDILGSIYEPKNNLMHLLLIEKLNFLDIKTISELEYSLKTYKDKIVSFAKEWVGHSGGYFNKGISVFYLCYVLVCEKNNLEYATMYFQKVITTNINIKKDKKQAIEDAKRLLDSFNALFNY